MGGWAHRPQPRFRLVRSFTLAGLAAFALVGAAMVLHEREQVAFFADAQAGQGRFLADVQSGLLQRQAEDGRADLLAMQQQGNVTVARVLANALREAELSRFLGRAAAVAAGGCGSESPESPACAALLNARIRGLAESARLDARVHAALRGTSVFKVKILDLGGRTLYSSDAAQVGEDRSANAGWRAARAGRTASELTHRDRFSAFEGVVENRDLVSTYLPLAGADGAPEAVFAVYADVTALLGRLQASAARTQAAAAANVAQLASVEAENGRRARDASGTGIAIVCVLLVTLFAALSVVVHRAARTLERQAAERELLQQRLGQAEKMSALGQMVAGVAHQLNTPLGFSQSNVSLVRERLAAMDPPPADAATLDEMLGDVLAGIGQMSELVVNMREFTRLDRAAEDDVDVNAGLRTVVYMARSVVRPDIRFEERYAPLPPVHCNASQINQVFLNLVTNAAQAIDGEGAITVASRAEAGSVVIEVRDTGVGIAPAAMPYIFESFYTTKPRGVGTGLGLPIARDIVRAHGGEIEVRSVPGGGTTFTVRLPAVREALRQAA